MTASDTSVVSGGVASGRVHALFAALLLGLLLAVLDQTVTGTAAWTIVRDLDAAGALAQLPWLATAYMMSSTIATPLFGRLSDVFGRRPIYTVAVSLFLAGSVLAGSAAYLQQLIAGRAVQGLGAGGLFALTFAIVADFVPPRERGRYIGAAMSVVGIASLGGPLLGGFFASRGGLFGLTTSWRWVFYLNIPLSVVVVAAVLSLLPAARGQATLRRSVDVVGAALLAAGVWAWLLVGEWGGQRYGWSSPAILRLMAVGTVTLTLFVVREAKASAPLVSTALFGNPIFRVANLISLTMGAALLGSVFYVTLYLQLVGHMDPTIAGLHLVPLMVGLMVSSAVAGQLMSKRGRYKVFPISGAILTTIGLALLAVLDADASGWVISLLLVIIGVGVGLATALLSVIVLNAVSPDEYGVASSSTTFTQTLGGVLGAAVFGAILNGQLRHALSSTPGGSAILVDIENISDLAPSHRQLVIDAFVRSSHVVFLTAAGVAIVAIILGCLLREIPLRKDLDPAAA